MLAINVYPDPVTVDPETSSNVAVPATAGFEVVPKEGAAPRIGEDGQRDGRCAAGAVAERILDVYRHGRAELPAGHVGGRLLDEGQRGRRRRAGRLDLAWRSTTRRPRR